MRQFYNPFDEPANLDESNTSDPRDRSLKQVNITHRNPFDQDLHIKEFEDCIFIDKADYAKP